MVSHITLPTIRDELLANALLFLDFHHHQNTGAYSSLMFLDWVFGTDRNYRAW